MTLLHISGGHFGEIRIERQIVVQIKPSPVYLTEVRCSKLEIPQVMGAE